MLVPEEARQILQQITPSTTSWDAVDLHFTSSIPGAAVMRSQVGAGICIPCALVPAGIISVTRRVRGTFSTSLKTVGMTVGHTVYLAINPKDLRTAAGLALLAHEKVHVDQYACIRNFQDLYTRAAERTPDNEPWRNPYEEMAYRVEARVFCRLVDAGYPKGKWTPLGVSLWGCNA